MQPRQTGAFFESGISSNPLDPLQLPLLGGGLFGLASDTWAIFSLWGEYFNFLLGGC